MFARVSSCTEEVNALAHALLERRKRVPLSDAECLEELRAATPALPRGPLPRPTMLATIQAPPASATAARPAERAAPGARETAAGDTPEDGRSSTLVPRESRSEHGPGFCGRAPADQ